MVEQREVLVRMEVVEKTKTTLVILLEREHSHVNYRSNELCLSTLFYAKAYYELCSKLRRLTALGTNFSLVIYKLLTSVTCVNAPFILLALSTNTLKLLFFCSDMDDGEDAGFPEQDDSIHAFTGHKGMFSKDMMPRALGLVVYKIFPCCVESQILDSNF